MRTSIFLLCLSVLNVATAQESSRPEPTAAHKMLARFVGTWDCKVKMYFEGADAPPTEFSGTEVNKLIAGDLYLKTTFKCKMGQRGEFEGHSLTGYDHRSRKYTGTWVDSFTSVPSHFTAAWNESSKQFTIQRRAVNARGAELKTKEITTWESSNKKKQEVFMLVKAGDKTVSVKLMESVAIRRD